MSLISLLMNIFRNLNEESVINRFKTAYVDAVIELIKKFNSTSILNKISEDDDLVLSLLTATDAFKSLLRDLNIEICQDGNGYYIYGYTKNIFGSRVPLGACYERFANESDLMETILDIISDTRLGNRLEDIDDVELLRLVAAKIVQSGDLKLMKIFTELLAW